jgi:hypothetical protein
MSTDTHSLVEVLTACLRRHQPQWTAEDEAAYQEAMRFLEPQDDTPLPWSLSIDPGDPRSGATAWCKVVESIDPRIPNGYGIAGPFVSSGRDRLGRVAHEYAGAHPAGTYLVACGRGGRQGKVTEDYALFRVRAGEECRHRAGYQGFWGEGLELVVTTEDPVDVFALMETRPDLAPCVGTPVLPIYAMLREEGY